jgi:hypothetical protein
MHALPRIGNALTIIVNNPKMVKKERIFMETMNIALPESNQQPPAEPVV